MLRLKLLFLLLIFSSFGLNAKQFGQSDIQVELPKIIVGDVSQSITLKIVSDSLYGQFEGVSKTVFLNEKSYEVTFVRNEAAFKYDFPEDEHLIIKMDDFILEKAVTPIPLWMSVFPPLIAIILALLLKEVFSALFVGILTGTSIMFYYQGVGFFAAIGKGFLAVIDTYVMNSLTDRGHLSIIVFSMMIGGMVQLISSNGGMKGVVNRLSVFARSSRSGQLVTWLLGMVIFFDDYANTLVVGNTMRPVADRLKISRAKLAYIVDSTAAPIAAIAFVTTWIGAELSYIQDGLNVIGLNQSAYNVFFNSLAYSFYPILTLIFVLMIILMKREYGPMLIAENAVRSQKAPQDEINSDSSETENNFETSVKSEKAMNAIIPVAVIIFGTISGLLYTGWDKALWANQEVSFITKISEIIGKSDSYAALLWSSVSALVVAFILTLSQRILNLQKTIESILEGFRIMMTAILILTLAWSVALVTEHMHTADFIAQSLLSMSFSPYLIPAFTFVLAALVAFSTGTSWGTMAILYPLLLPTSWMLTESAPGIDHEHGLTIFYSVVSAVLSGAILGDHVSPISDTTILSSISSGCNHIEHVRTQMPYALTVGFVAVVFGTIPAAYGFVSSWVLMLLGVVILFGFIHFFGKKVINQTNE